jgi:hypothetical protein
MPRLRPTHPFSDQHKQLWTHINELVHTNGGAIVSQKFWDPIRLECASSSPIPSLLAERGFCARAAGTVERLAPTTVQVARSRQGAVWRDVIVPTTMAVFEVEL